jgi:hypothetical protein
MPTDSPKVSVVMSVYNGAIHLPDAVESILSQTLCDLEFIIVNDGSLDDSLNILKRYQAADSRIRVIDQPNQGLTNALIVGCRSARGEFIARQDVGDRSLPQRLERQVAVLDRDPTIVAVGSGVRRFGPNGEFLNEHVRSLSGAEVTHDLHHFGIGLVHACSAFRSDAFHFVGGYRPEFRFAQDTDLWYRLSSVGQLAECPEVLFEMRIETTGISGTQIEKQIRLSELARACHFERMAGKSEAAILQEAERISRKADVPLSRREVRHRAANACYFIGSELFQRRDARCRTYLSKSMKSTSRLVPALAKYLASFPLCDSLGNNGGQQHNDARPAHAPQ